jgi:hypothetical protein
MFADSRRAEQLSLFSQQRVVATVEDSVLKTEMAALSLRKRMLLSVSSSSIQWVGWGRSGLTVGMSPGLLVFGRHLSPRLWVLRSRWLWRSRSRLAVAGNFS